MQLRGCRVAALACGALLACMAPPKVAPTPVPPMHCASTQEVEHTVFLIGDAGAPRLPKHREAELPVDPVLLALRRDVLEQAGMLGVDRVTVVYLGDNVTPRGLVPVGEPSRARGERVLRMLIRAAEPARVVFTAGDRDWDVEGTRGWDNVRAQAEFLSAQGERVSMLPPGGCAGPDRVDFGEHLRIVLIDPLGRAHAREAPQVHAAVCPHGTDRGTFPALAGEHGAPEARHLVLALHDPSIALRPQPGSFTWKQHLFPLTDFVSWLWLPLPAIGSAYPISRALRGAHADATVEASRGWSEEILDATRPGVPLLFVSGHEHSLQLHRDGNGSYYAVSGAGSATQVSRVEPLSTALFALAEPGYMRLDAYADGALGLTALAVLEGEHSEPVMRHCLADAAPSGRGR